MRGFLKFLKYNQEHISDLKTKKVLNELTTHLSFCKELQGYIAASLTTNKELVQAYRDFKAEDIENKKIFLPDLFKMIVGNDDKSFVYLQIAITPVSVLPLTYIRDDEPFFDSALGRGVHISIGQNVHENIPTIHTLNVKVPVFLPENIGDPKKLELSNIHNKVNDIIFGRDLSTNLENMLLFSAEKILAIDLLSWPLVFETLVCFEKMTKASLCKGELFFSAFKMTAEMSEFFDPKKLKKISRKVFGGLSEVVVDLDSAAFTSALDKDIADIMSVYTSPCNVLLAFKKYYLACISGNIDKRLSDSPITIDTVILDFLINESPYLLPLCREDLFIGLAVAIQKPQADSNMIFGMFDNILSLAKPTLTKMKDDFGGCVNAYVCELLTCSFSDLLEPLWGTLRYHRSLGTKELFFMGLRLDLLSFDRDVLGHLVSNLSLLNTFASLVQNVETVYKTLITLPLKQYFYLSISVQMREKIFGKTVNTPGKAEAFSLSLDDVDALLDGLIGATSDTLILVERPVNERFMDLKDNRGRYFLNTDITLRMRDVTKYDNLLFKLWVKKASGIVWELLDPNNETVNLEYPTLVVLASLLVEELENVCDLIRDLNESRKSKQLSYFKYLQKMNDKQEHVLGFDAYVMNWDELFDSGDFE